jgi:hypothetical protein
MKRILTLCAAGALASACAAMPDTAAAGEFQANDAGFAITLDRDWSRWPSNLNFATNGDFLTQDGVLLNRVHLVTLEDGEALVRAGRDAEVPRFSTASTEFEIVDMITSSLMMIGYNSVEADAVRPASIDGADGLRIGITGRWENGLRVKGDAAVVVDSELHMVLFMAPELHYYDALSEEVNGIMNSMDLESSTS